MPRGWDAKVKGVKIGLCDRMLVKLTWYLAFLIIIGIVLLFGYSHVDSVSVQELGQGLAR